jgi:Carboxypeptidase regulatory-like domain
MRVSRSMFCLVAILFCLVAAIRAQDSKKEAQKEAQLRTVRGTISDKSDEPLSGSVVFLKNLRTNDVRSNFADDKGEYRFSGLDPNADYEIHAEFEGAKSPVRSVTSLDSRREIVINLKIDRKKS